MNLFSSFWRALAAAGVLGVAGCATGEMSMVATTYDGQKIHVPVGRNGVVLTNEDGVEIEAATFALKTEKKFTYVFAFTDKQKRALRSVRVEDVADEKPVVLVDDAAPKLSATGQWQHDSEAIDPNDPRLAWLATLQNSLRVYRFTLTFADGKTLVLHQGAFFPQPMKSALRQLFGKNY